MESRVEGTTAFSGALTWRGGSAAEGGTDFTSVLFSAVARPECRSVCGFAAGFGSNVSYPVLSYPVLYCHNLTYPTSYPTIPSLLLSYPNIPQLSCPNLTLFQLSPSSSFFILPYPSPTLISHVQSCHRPRICARSVRCNLVVPWSCSEDVW